MTDHTYCYTAAVQRIRDAGRGGHARAVPVHRLGAHQPGPGAARHRRVLGPRAARPVDPRLRAARWLHAGRGRRPGRRPDRRRASRASATSRCTSSGGAIAHIHVNWLSPTKIRTTIIGGSRSIVVWDDLNPSQRLSLYDKGVDLDVVPRHGRRAAQGAGLVPRRRHDRPRAARDRSAPGRRARVRRRHPRTPGTADRRRRRAARRADPRGGRARASTPVGPRSRSVPTDRSAIDAGAVAIRDESRTGADHRWRRHRRLHHRRPAGRKPAPTRSSCSTTSAGDAPRTSRGRSPTGTVSLVVGRHQRHRGVARRDPEGCDVVFHQAAIRITQCAEEPRLAFDVMVAGTFNVAEAAVAAGVGKVVVGVVGGGLRAWPRRSRRRRSHHPVRQPHAVRRGEGVRRDAASAPSTRCTASTTSRCATSTCTGPAWPSRRAHRGAGPVDGAHRERRARR